MPAHLAPQVLHGMVLNVPQLPLVPTDISSTQFQDNVSPQHLLAVPMPSGMVLHAAALRDSTSLTVNARNVPRVQFSMAANAQAPPFAAPPLAHPTKST